jgi:hypothetical protein
MSDAFKRLEVCDRFSPEIKATFTRRHEENDTIVITTEQAGDFHLDAGTLGMISTVLQSSPSTKEIK